MDAYANAAADVSEADVLTGPYLHGDVSDDGGLAPSCPAMLSTEPSAFCIRVIQSSSHFASSSRSATPLPDSGVFVSSANAAGLSVYARSSSMTSLAPQFVYRF